MLDYDNRASLGDFNQYFGDPKSSIKELCFLMPTGLSINLKCDVKQTFAQIKNSLWKQVESMPGYDTLHVPTRYAFNIYNNKFEKEEIFDENTKLQDLKIFRSIVNVVERIGDKDEKLYNMRIGSIICLPIFRILSMSGKEEKDFRRKIHAMCEEVVNERQNENIIQRMEEVYPPILSGTIGLSDELQEHCDSIKFHVHFSNDRHSQPLRYKEAILKESGECSPEQILQHSLDYWHSLGEIKESEYNAGLYFLKVAGAEEYLYGDHQVIYFKQVQRCVSERKMIKLIVIKRASLQRSLSYVPFKRCSSIRPTDNVEDEQLTHRPRDLWDISGKFSITVCKTSNVLAENDAVFYVKMCLYHGGEPLVPEVKTQPRNPFPSNPEWNDLIDFDINIADLPRNVRLCCVLYSRKKGRKREQSHAWVNIPLFDYKGMLKSDSAKLNMWECSADDETFNYIGVTTTNTKADCPTLHLKFPPNISNVRYPEIQRICMLSASLLRDDKEDSERSIKQYGLEKLRTNDSLVFCLSEITEPPQNYIDNLVRIVNKDPLEELFEDEKTLLWQMRVYCQSNLKNSLPKLLRCFDWSDHKKAATMKQMVGSWQPLDPEYALELLDYQYPDELVRDFAVEKCLENLTDAQLGLYLLQLVQVLKYESYLNNSLTRFLLKRAIKNSRIGHNFFWHLKSEMHDKELTTRFGLILEAYCRSNVHRTEEMWAQHLALELFQNAAKKAKQETVFKENSGGTTQTIQLVRQTLEQGNKTMIPFQSTSMPHVKIKSIRADRSRIMDSKKKPLWLECENFDSLGEDTTEMFKIGDDLRQDYLSMQTIGIMDQLWQNNQMDLKLSLYGVISTGDNIGLIAPVKDSKTLSAIQLKYGLSTDSLYKWLKDQNKTEEALEEAINNFTKSCAGYVVATYVLGIGDRHSDNIMMNKNGKLFHIDFGHFLGNYKQFAVGGIGIKRERVPMIMISDFVYIITKGRHQTNAKAKDDPHFKKFLDTCLRAFQIIRQKSTLFINLFALMCSSGIPELTSLEDLQYLKTALSLDDTEEVAISNFRKKIMEALKNEKWAKLNFWIHNQAHH